MPGIVICDGRDFGSRTVMNFEESALCFSCRDAWLYGVLSLPERPVARGVLVVVGGPQYRAGSHRQFTLLARDLSFHGVPVMRFDYRGMGDSEGGARNFEEVNDDLRCAIDHFFQQVPSLEELVVWGLCDAASAALFYASDDRRVTGLVLLNPWVRTEESIAKTYLSHYYRARLFAPELWKKIFGGKFNYAAAGRSFLTLMGDAFLGNKKQAAAIEAGGAVRNLLPIHERMCDGLSRFKGRVLLILSGDDFTAKEFSDLANASRKWRTLLRSSRVTRFDLPQANHTFSRHEWRDQVATWTREWLRAW